MIPNALRTVIRSLHINRDDWWVGYYRGSTRHYACPLPTVVLSWPRRSATRRGAPDRGDALTVWLTAQRDQYPEGSTEHDALDAALSDHLGRVDRIERLIATHNGLEPPMGNWRIVNITGRIDPAEVDAVRAHLLVDLTNHTGLGNFGPLSVVTNPTPLCGLGDWPAAEVDAVGTLAERNYTPASVVTVLRGLVAIAPSLDLTVHCGGDHESTRCVATIVARDGEVEECEPALAEVRPLDLDLGERRLMQQITRPGR